MKSYFLLFTCFLLSMSQSFSAINQITISQSSATDCDTVVVTVSGTHACPNDFITGVTHTISGSNIIINLTVSTGICIPPIPAPTFVQTYTLPLSSVSVGNYTLRGNYNSILFVSTTTLNVTSCCPFLANAGNDTSFCDVSSMQLNGNSPPAGATSAWTVFSGNGSLTGSTMPNATINNMSYGQNSIIWSVTDTACTTTDTITISNFEPATTASTESDRMACEDTSTIMANSPIVGNGKWKSHTIGAIVSNVNSANSLTSFIIPGAYKLSWTITNGICKSSDTLLITYSVLDSATVISENNYVLTSTAAPQYQWYLDGNAISGATGMTHIALVNGTYSVLASLAGCTTGLFSNEIELTTVGITEGHLESNTNISPNPSSGLITIRSDKIVSYIAVYDLKGQLLKESFVENKEIIQLDLAELNPNVYMIHLTTRKGIIYKKVIIY